MEEELTVSDDGQFEWDENKNRLNRKKYGIGFEEIYEVFYDPYFLVRYDKAHSLNEDRFNGIGCINGLLVLVTTYTERNGRTRIISAQRADSSLRKVYYDYVEQINS